MIAALTASPVAAETAPPPTVQDQHYRSLWNAEGRLCFERSQRETLELEDAVEVCLKSLDGLAQKRRSLRNPKPYELANFDYSEAMLLSGLGAAYARRDGADTTYTCAAVERLWAVAVRLKGSSKDGIAPTWASSYDRLPGTVVDVVLMCRDERGTPEGAPPASL